MKKYELTEETFTVFGKTLYRIRAVRDFGSVKTGEFGGYIEKEENLSHFGNAWVYGNAKVYGDAKVSGKACVCGDAEVSNTRHFFVQGPIGSRDGFVTFYRTNLMQNDMVALRAVMRLGWEIPNPINSQQKDKAKRCPFAVLAPAV